MAAGQLQRILVVLYCAALAGCAATGERTVRLPPQRRTRVGRVYVFRGFLGIWSTGMDGMTEKLQRQGVVAEVFRNDQWHAVADSIVREREGKADVEPLVILGHSFGADNALRVCRTLKSHGIAVDLVITLEGATPPTVPTNVRHAINIYKPRRLDFLPWWRGVPVHDAAGRSGDLQQIDIPRDWPDIDRWDLGHSDVDDEPKIQDRIVAKIVRYCPTLDEWAARQRPIQVAASPATREAMGDAPPATQEVDEGASPAPEMQEAVE